MSIVLIGNDSKRRGPTIAANVPDAQRLGPAGERQRGRGLKVPAKRDTRSTHANPSFQSPLVVSTLLRCDFRPDDALSVYCKYAGSLSVLIVKNCWPLQRTLLCCSLLKSSWDADLTKSASSALYEIRIRGAMVFFTWSQIQFVPESNSRTCPAPKCIPRSSRTM